MTMITSKYQATTRLVFHYQTLGRRGNMALGLPIVIFLCSALFVTIHTITPLLHSLSNEEQLAAVSHTTQATTQTIDTSVTLPLPVRLYIPKIKVDAIIEPVGLTPSGAMAAPSGPATVAWYALGPHPGQIGSAVIAGHYGYKRSAAAFDDLFKLRKGDVIYTMDDRGKFSGFSVLYARLYRYTDNQSIIFNSEDGKKYLNLVTCEGVWDKAAKNYANRRVVFAEQIF